MVRKSMNSNRRTSRARGMGNRVALSQSKLSRIVKSAVSLAKGKRNYATDLAVSYDAGLVKLAQHRKWLLAAVVFGLIATVLVWIVALRFPHAVSVIYANGVNSDLPSRYSTVLTILLMSVPFGPPFISVFALTHLLFPSPMEPELASGVMSSFDYAQKSNKRSLIIIVAGVVGALNCLLLIISFMDRK